MKSKIRTYNKAELRRFSLFSMLAIVLIAFTGCSRDEESPADPFLTGTEWEYKEIENASITVEEDPMREMLESALGRYPELEYDKQNIPLSDEETQESSSPLYTLSSLKFDENTCLYKKEEVVKITRYLLTYNADVYTFKAKTYGDPVYLQVLPDGIYECDSYNGEKRRICLLVNYQIKIANSHSTPTGSETVSNVHEEYRFTYERNGDEVLMSNDNNMRWVGELDADNGRLSVKQVSPEKKEIDTFELK